MRARTCAKRFCDASAFSTGTGLPFSRIEKAYRSPTKPESEEALLVVPVFARTRPRR